MKLKLNKLVSISVAIGMLFFVPLQILANGSSSVRRQIGQIVTSVSLGFYHSAAITSNGDLYCWGDNSYGQIGNGKREDQLTPEKVLEDVLSVSLGCEHSAAIISNGDLYCWGYNRYGQIGNGRDGITEKQLLPEKVLEDVVSVSLGYYHSAAITSNGDLYCWGNNLRGEIGNGTTVDQLLPEKVLENVTSVSLGAYYSAAITSNGDLYCWGKNDYGQIGNGTTETQLTPKKVLEDVVSVSLGVNGNQSAAITSSGDLYCWGENRNGQIGNGTRMDQLTPEKVLEDVTSVSLGEKHSAAITSNGDLYCWGKNLYGQIGNGTTEIQLTPKKVLEDVTSVLLSGWHSMAIKKNGDLYCWGYNEDGRIGNGTTETQLTPEKVLEDVTSVPLGLYHSAAITSNGNLYCWGNNDSGQVGNGAREDQLTPIKISFDNIADKAPDSVGEVKVASNNNLTFSVYDGAGANLFGTPLAGAQITVDDIGTAQTDEKGIAVIENTVTDVAVVNKKITITKQGYKDYVFYQDIYNKDITEWFINPNKISVLMTPLKTGEDAFPYVSTVTLQAGSTTVRNALDTAYVFDSRESVRNGKIRINAVWNGKTPKSYRIYSEDEKKSYTSEDGVFEFDMLNAFSSGSPIWVELTATDGTGIKQKTKISVKQYSTGSPNKGTLTLVEAKTNTSIGNDKPLLSGQSIDFKIKGIKMTASVSEGKVKIKLGTDKKLTEGEMFSDEDWKEWKDACELQPTDLNLTHWKNLMEAYDISATSYVSGKAKIYGYLEGTLENGKDTILTGTIKLDTSLEGGVKSQYFVGGIPVYATVSVYAKGDAAGQFGFNWSKFCIDEDTTELSFTLTPGLEAEAGIGVMAVATVGVSGEGSLPIKTKVGKPDAVNISLKGEMAIKTSVLGFDYTLTLAENTWQLYPAKETKTTAYAMQLNDFEVADRSYAKKDSSWTGGKIVAAKAMGLDKNGNSVESVLASNIYPDAQIQLIETNQTRMLLWTEDDKSRQDIDRSKLVYSVYNETSGWSLPQAVADDGTADYSPTVVADDSHIYVAWQNNGKAYGTHAELADVSKETEICMSIWDDDNKSFAQAVQMSEDKNASYSPKIALNGDGNPYIVYVTNSDGNPFLIKGKNDLCCAVYDGATVNNMALASDAGLVTSYSTKYTNQYELSYTLDVDGDYSTQDDRELYFVKNGKAENITKNSGMDSNVQYIDWNGKIYRFWYAGDSIVMADNVGKQTVIYKDETGLLTDDFSVITGDASQLAVVWASTNEQGNKQIQGVMYNPIDNGFTNLVQLSDLEGDICLPSGVFLTDGSILFAYKKAIGDETDLCTYHCAFETDMAVEHAYCDEEDLISGQKAPVNVEVKNAGLQTIQRFQVDIEGTKTEFSDVLMPGESKIVTAYYEVPDTLNYGLVNVTVETLGDTEASNDTYEMTVGYTDVSVKVTDNNLGNGHIISVEASNDSYVNSKTKLYVYSDRLNGTLIKTIDFGELQHGNVTTVDYIWNKSTEGYRKDISALYFVLETEGKERFTNNNYDFVAVGADEGDEEEIKVKAISLNKASSQMNLSNTLQLTATITPSNATNKTLLWSSDNPSVATVDQNGLVTAVSAGKATITAKAQDGSGISAACIVEVTGSSNNGGSNTGGGSSSGGGYYPSGGGSSSTGGGTSTGGNSSTGNNTTSGDSTTTPGNGNGNTSTPTEPTIKVLYYIVKFDKNGGKNLSRQKMTLLQDDSLGILPKVERKNYKFLGWFTQPTGGKKVDQKKVLNVSTSLFAHWEKISKPSKGKISSLKSKKAGTMTVKCNKQSGAKGYEIVYSKDKKFKASATKKKVSASTSATLKGLKKGQTYYVKIRAYKVDSTGAKVYGSYSAIKKVKIKK